jgi:phasin
MSQQDQSKKLLDKSATIASETFAKGQAAAEHSARAVGQSYSTSLENLQEYQVKMIEMAQANAAAAFELARQLATVKAPSDIMELWTSHARKQFEMLGEQTRELTALGQKVASESTAPLARSFGQTFQKTS